MTWNGAANDAAGCEVVLPLTLPSTRMCCYRAHTRSGWTDDVAVIAVTNEQPFYVRVGVCGSRNRWM